MKLPICSAKCFSVAPLRAISVLLALALFCNAGHAVAAQEPRAPADARPAAHFLEQATFGPTAADVAFVEANSLDTWLLQ